MKHYHSVKETNLIYFSMVGKTAWRPSLGVCRSTLSCMVLCLPAAESSGSETWTVEFRCSPSSSISGRHPLRAWEEAGGFPGLPSDVSVAEFLHTPPATISRALLPSGEETCKGSAVSDSLPVSSPCSESEPSVSDDVVLSDSSESLASGLEEGVCCLDMGWAAFNAVSSSCTRSAAASSSSRSRPSWAFVRDSSFKASARAANFLDLQSHLKKY